MTKQIIHIDSTYRDRIIYPNPADFIVEYGSPVCTNSIFSMRNPVTFEMPIYNFSFPLVPPYNYSIDFINNTSPIANSSLKIGMTNWNAKQVVLDPVDISNIFGASSSYEEHDFLRNLYFVYGSTFPYTIVRIVAYNSLTYTLTLDSTVFIDLSTLDYCYIYNDSMVDTTDFKLLLSGYSLKNILTPRKLFLYNATRNETLSVVMPANDQYLYNTDSNHFTSWSVNDFYMLYDQQPNIRILKPFDNGKYYNYSVKTLTLLESSPKFPVNHTFPLYLLQTSMLSTIVITIKRVDISGKILEFDITDRGTDVLQGSTYFISDTTPDGTVLYALFKVTETYQSFLVEGTVNLGCNEFFTPFLFTPLYNNNDSFVNDQISFNVLPIIYNNYVDLVSKPYNQLQNVTGASMIYSTQPYSGDTLVFTTAYDESILSLFDASYSNNWWNNVMFSSVYRDQFVPLNYTGSTVSQDQLVCYQVELLNLILPNLELNTTKVLTSFYPYLFVELSPTSSLTRNINVLYTNNQYGQSALFAVPISDVNSPEISQFLNLNNCKSIQTIKFKPNDSLHFRVFLTNGQTFTPYLKDTIPPIYPNPLVQISAIFSIQRLG